MLILTRRVGETLMVGSEVKVSVLGVRGSKVKIGIVAPKDLPIHREEVFLRIKNEGAGAVSQAKLCTENGS